jgi:hypothetical protein
MPCTKDLCRQGRLPCPTRRACFGFPDPDEPIASPEEAFGWLEFSLSLIAGVLFILILALGAGFFLP